MWIKIRDRKYNFSLDKEYVIVLVGLEYSYGIFIAEKSNDLEKNWGKEVTEDIVKRDYFEEIEKYAQKLKRKLRSINTQIISI